MDRPSRFSAHHAAEKCGLNLLVHAKNAIKDRETYLVGSLVFAESDISVNSKDLIPLSRIREMKVREENRISVIHTRSFAGNSGIVLSFSMIFCVKLSTKVSQSFFDAR